MRRFLLTLPVLAGATAGAIVALVIGGGSSSTTVTETVVSGGRGNAPAATAVPTSSRGPRSGLAINALYKRDAPGVVDITVTSQAAGSGSGGLFGLGGGGGSGTQEDEGAGVVYDRAGNIITDEHVVSGANPKIMVHFQDGVNAPATIVGTPDASTDVAVIHVSVPPSQLHPLPFANSNTAQVGDPVIAIGSPFSLPETVTQGIVSQTGRAITAPNNFTITGAIQTDAAINPGNSGGPLIDAAGQVLGLNDQIQTNSGSSAGIGFATPSNTDRQVADLMIAGRRVQHAYVGFCVQDWAGGGGAQVATSGSTNCTTPVVAGSPAARAGLVPGDVVTAVDGRRVTSSDDFVAVLTKYAPGQTVTFTVIPNNGHGKARRVKITLGNRPQAAPTAG